MSSHRGFILPYLTSAPRGGRILLGVLALLAVLVGEALRVARRFALYTQRHW